MRSLPSRERGLKLKRRYKIIKPTKVAPLAGARIEILAKQSNITGDRVAPLAGARIEIAALFLGN